MQDDKKVLIPRLSFSNKMHFDALLFIKRSLIRMTRAYLIFKPLHKCLHYTFGQFELLKYLLKTAIVQDKLLFMMLIGTEFDLYINILT